MRANESSKEIEDSKTGRNKTGYWYENIYLRKDLARKFFGDLEKGQNRCLYGLLNHVREEVGYNGS